MRHMITLMLGVLWLTAAGESLAQSTFSAARPQQARVVCAARGVARQQCGADLRGYVFSRAIDAAGSRCEVGRNFGYGDTAMWIEQGCGGEFFFTNRGDAMVPTAVAGGERSVRCESQDGRRANCAADLVAYALRNLRQQSRTNCVEGENWGWDDRGVYVDQGCRVDFLFVPRTDQGMAAGAASRTVGCASRDARRAECAADLTGYVMRDFRQVSRSVCLAGQSFGVSERGVWADRGCRVEVVFDYVGNRGRGYVRSSSVAAASTNPPGGATGLGSVPTTIRCESVDNGRNNCAAAFAVRARVSQQLSRSACTEGSSWGLDNRGLWVDQGCRADFEVFR